MKTNKEIIIEELRNMYVLKSMTKEKKIEYIATNLLSKLNTLELKKENNSDN